MLSNTCKYGVRAMIYLAVNVNDGRKIGIKQISKDLDIPTPFLAKIMQVLAKSKVLTSTKGPHGGFGLSHDSDDISVYDIILMIDGDKLFSECILGTGYGDDTDKKPCLLQEPYEPIRKALIQMFKNATLSSLATLTEAEKEVFSL